MHTAWWRAMAALVLAFIFAREDGAMPALAAGARPEAPTPDVARLPAQAARLYAAIKKAHPDELNWQQIPWLVDLSKGIGLAKEESRPLLLFVSGDDPLEKC